MDNELISVIVPVYNVEKYLHKCVNSIIAQTYKNLEIILVDDGSKDKSGKICDEFLLKDNRIVVIHKEGGGAASARNAGLDIAKGRYIGFVDSDDWIERDMYECMYAAIKKYNADMACVGTYRDNEQANKTQIIRCPNKEKIYNEEKAFESMLTMRNVGMSLWSKLFKAEIFEKLRLPVGEVHEDIAILPDLMNNRITIHIGQPKYHYIMREGSVTATYSEDDFDIIYRNSLNILNYLNLKYENIAWTGRYYMAYNLKEMLVKYMQTGVYRNNKMKKYFSEYKKYWREIIKADVGVKIKISAILVRSGMYRYLYKLKNIV